MGTSSVAKSVAVLVFVAGPLALVGCSRGNGPGGTAGNGRRIPAPPVAAAVPPTPGARN